jgi:hypothetical protein
MEYTVDDVFRVISRDFPEAGVGCLMIGGHAVNAYGVLRATQDVDFMIAAEDESMVRRLMTSTGFTNVTVMENVIFFCRPQSPLRIDFLKVDGATMKTLLGKALSVDYTPGYPIQLPCLFDLIAMKLFALRSSPVEREDKDFPDIVRLAMEHAIPLETELKSLCEQFGPPSVYQRVCARIQELNDA